MWVEFLRFLYIYIFLKFDEFWNPAFSLDPEFANLGMEFANLGTAIANLGTEFANWSGVAKK